MTETATSMNDEPPLPKEKRGRFGINKNLIMLKLSLFFLYGATSSLVPYLPLHMQSIGLTMDEIALIYLALPCTTFLAPPVSGFLVDKFGKYKPVVIISFLLNAALHHSLLLIPHQETPGIVPQAFVLMNPETGAEQMWWSPCTNRQCPEEDNTVSLMSCIDHCTLTKTRNLSQFEDNERFLSIGNMTYAARLTGRQREKLKKPKNITFEYHFKILPNLAPNVDFGIEPDIQVNGKHNYTNVESQFDKTLLKSYGINITAFKTDDLRCGAEIVTISSQRIKWNTTCIMQKCHFEKGGPDVCLPDFKESDDRTFWIYFTLRFLANIMMTVGVTIMDPIAFTMIEKYGGDFGREKLFSSIGMAIFSPITGGVIQYWSSGLGYTDYSPSFYAYDTLLLIAALCVLLMPLGTKLPADNIFRDLANIVKMPHVMVFIIFLFVLGNLWGFIESFLFLYLKDLSAPMSLLGITVTVGTISSMPFLYGADKITKRIGHVYVIIIAFFAHAGRLMGYSLIENPWWCFPFEAMESLSVHLMWVAAATYCAILAPKTLLATLIGIAGMAHFSIGRGSGSFIGGYLIKWVGIRQAFRLMGLGAMIAGGMYVLMHIAWLRKFDSPAMEDEDILEPDENEKLKGAEPKYKDQSTMVSFERLSLMIEYNQIGSLSSLGRLSRGETDPIKRARSNSIRRGSYNIGSTKQYRGSASKVDLLKSTSEVSHTRGSTPQLKNSTGYLSRNGSTKIPDGNAASLSKLVKGNTINAEGLLNKIPKETDELEQETSQKENDTNEKK